MEKYTGTVFIGRFQPLHLAHEELIKHALEVSEKVLIIIGSTDCARTIKNPLTYEERKAIILWCFSQYKDRIVCEPQRDYFYNEVQWKIEVTESIKKHFNLTDSLGLIGMYKDHSSYYLSNFPFLEFIPYQPRSGPKGATEVRKLMFEDPYNEESKKWEDKKMKYPPWYNSVPTGSRRYVQENFLKTDNFKKLQDEYKFIKDYKKQWSKSPYPPSFVTSDFILKCGSNILLVKRKFGLGKGLLALPGGFIRQHETSKQAAVRELREETCLDIDPEDLTLLIKSSKVFDHPARSLRGRTITNAFLGEIPFKKELPKVKGADDAEEAMWMPIYDIHQRTDEFFEDHYHIIHYFLTQEGK